ncbi:MAG: LCP family protein [Chloroflexi bacterium]|nr:LCP family protein [Chloroflexota bacterium]
MKSYPGQLAILFLALTAACQAAQPPPAPTPAPLEASPAAPWVQIFLPITENQRVTATPFQPLAATPTPLPTATPAPLLLNPRQPSSDFPRPSAPLSTPMPPPMPVLSDEGTFNILLIGSDQRGDGSYRTDTLVILSVRPRDGVVTLISIPRDLFVYIPGWTMQRVNTAYMHGETSRYPGRGPGLLADTILYNLGIRIDHTAMVDFGGFRKIVNTLEGVDVPLVCSFTDWHVINPKGDLENPNNWRLYTIGPGIVHMDGDLALWYARSRLRSNDFDRGRRQQEVLRAIFARGMTLDILPRLPDLYNQFRETIRTDLSLEEIITLAPLALDLNAPRIRSYYINNTMVKSWHTPEGAAVLLPRRERIEPLIREAMAAPDPFETQHLALIVEVWNGTRYANWDVLAAERLHYAGYETRLAPADRNDYSKTILLDLTADQDPNRAGAILSAFKLSANRLRAQPGAGGADYRLILGADYDPCFRPAKLVH